MEEYQDLRRKGLPIDEYGVSLEDLTPLHLPPVTALDYLFRVRLEADACQQVVIAPNRLDLIMNKPENCPSELDVRAKYFKEQSSLVDEAVTHVLPSQEWCSMFARKMRKDRKKYEAWIDQFEADLTSFPSSADEVNWKRFCYGTFNAQTTSTLPTLDMISKLNQKTMLLLLKFNQKWLSTDTFTPLHLQWIFALFLGLSALQSAEGMSVLRMLCMRLKEIRKRIACDPMWTDNSLAAKSDMRIVGLNMLITIVTHVFGQKDLVDNSPVSTVDEDGLGNFDFDHSMSVTNSKLPAEESA